MENIMSYTGEIYSLLTAVVWAFAVILFKKSGESVHPIALNYFKTFLAIILFIPTIFLFKEQIFRNVPINEYLLLLLSGVIGIGISDTLFFKSLNLIGAGMSAIVDCLYSPFIIGLSIIFLHERLSILQLIGAFMIVSAVLTGMTRKSRGKLNKKKLFYGALFGAMAMALMAVSIVMIKPLLNRSPLLWVTEIRLIGGIIFLSTFLIIHPSRKMIITSIHAPMNWIYTVSGSFFGAYLAMMLWLAGMKYTLASTAAALSQTSNIFVFIFAAIFLKEKINLQRVIAILLGVSGVFLVSFG